MTSCWICYGRWHRPVPLARALDLLAWNRLPCEATVAPEAVVERRRLRPEVSADTSTSMGDSLTHSVTQDVCPVRCVLAGARAAEAGRPSHAVSAVRSACP
jgi:hypothetical protein